VGEAHKRVDVQSLIENKIRKEVPKKRAKKPESEAIDWGRHSEEIGGPQIEKPILG